MSSLSFKEIIQHEINSGQALPVKQTISRLLSGLQYRAVLMFRIGQILKVKIPVLSGIIRRRIAFNYGCHLSLNAKVGLGLRLPHPQGIVIGDAVTIGQNCTIYQQVTLGAKKIGDAQKSQYPIIGDNVTIFSGAKIIGKLEIGNNCIIGANSVVTKSFPPYSIIGGVPGRVIKKLRQGGEVHKPPNQELP